MGRAPAHGRLKLEQGDSQQAHEVVNKVIPARGATANKQDKGIASDPVRWGIILHRGAREVLLEKVMVTPPGVILPPRPQWTIWQTLEAFLVVRTRGQGEAWGAAQCPTMRRTAPHDKAFSSSKCQQCQGSETLV